MFRRLLTGVALSSAVGIAAIGCGESTGPGEGEGPEVSWAGGVCDQLKKNGSKLKLPEIDRSKPVAAHERMVGFLGDLSTQLGDLRQALQKDGPPPIDGGRATYDEAMRNLADSKRVVDDSAAALKAQKVTDQASLQQAMAEAGKAMKGYGDYHGPARDLTANADLKTAFDRAPSCSHVLESAEPRQ